MTETCGHDKADGTPCKLPASRPDGRCHHHTDHADEQAPSGRPPAFDDADRRDTLINAVSTGLSIRDQAALAGVSKRTLQRSLCCIDTPRECELTTTDPCEFCRRYVRARGQGAMEVLQECKPEFRASASYGYVKTEKQELTGEDGDDIKVTSDVVTVTREDLE